MRIIGLDIHRAFAEAVAFDDGEYTRLGRVGMTRDQLGAFAAMLRLTDHVVVEATGNATVVLEILAPHVGRVAVANPLQVHLIAKAKTKTDKIDARVLVKLYAAGFLPEVWIPDEETMSRRRNVTRRNQLVKSRIRLKAMTQSILHAHLVPVCPHADLFGVKGRAWLRAQHLPQDERETVERHIAEYDRLTEAQKGVERDIARVALDDPDARRLMTIPGVDMVVAVGLMAAIGTIERFASPDKLVAYFGLNPSVSQSGEGPAQSIWRGPGSVNLERARLIMVGSPSAAAPTRATCWSKPPGGELWPAGAELVGDVAPSFDGGLLVGLVESLADRGGDDGMLTLGHMGERVPDPVNPTPLPGRIEHPRDRGLEAGMGVGDHQLHAVEAPALEAAKELGPRQVSA